MNVIKPFMDENFLLKTDTAVSLYNNAKDLPIVDYHCHLIPKEIAENKRFENITDLALRGDHYKWRLMRACGVDEKYITGNASDEEKFTYWCRTIEDCIGNPIYHWTHLEMRRYFDYDGPITGDRAKEIYDHCNKIINGSEFCAWEIFKKFNVKQVGTTDDPADTLEHHIQMAKHRENDKALPLVTPTLRPSNALDIESPNFLGYLKKLGSVSGVNITNWDNFLAALKQRIDFFDSVNCLASDHALDPPVYEERGNAEDIFAKALKSEPLTQTEVNRFKTALMVWLGEQYNSKGWIMQLHMGAQRNNNTRMFKQLGADTGYDAMSDAAFSLPLARLMDALESKNALPKTILYALNPVADAMLSVMIGGFQGGGIPGKIQWGSAWWFNDTKTGMQNHLIALANNGVLARFVGMLTDSRSFMSYPRHEYFRRILAQVIADWIDNGEFPNDTAKLNKIMGDICCNNAVQYFGLK